MRYWTYKLMTDESLMRAYARGDAKAFEPLYNRHKRALFLFLRRQCDDAAVCEDLAHDAWMAVIRGAGAYQVSATFKTWLFGIAHRRLIDHWRKFGSSAKVLYEEIADASAATHDVAVQGIEIEELLANLNQLSSDQTEALLLKIEGFSHAEIAAITGAKQETVKSRLRYATRRLRVSMEATS